MDAITASLPISRRTLIRVLAVVAAGLVVVSLSVPLIRLGYGKQAWLPLIEVFYVGAERSIATWLAAALLGMAAVGAALLGERDAGESPRHAWAWRGLSLLLLLFSVDEVATIHERVGGKLESWFDFDGLFRFAWVVPGIAVVIALACLFVPFLRRLPRSIARRLVIAGVVFVAGALGMEMVGGCIVTQHGTDAMHESALYALIEICEEALEMLGVLILLDALLRCLESQSPEAACR